MATFFFLRRAQVYNACLRHKQTGSQEDTDAFIEDS